MLEVLKIDYNSRAINFDQINFYFMLLSYSFPSLITDDLIHMLSLLISFF